MFNIELTHDLEGIEDFAKGLGNQLEDPDLRKSASDLITGFKKVISGGRFSPLSQSTIDIRSRRGRGGSRPLKDTGGLQRSIKVLMSRKANVEIGSRPFGRAGFLRAGGVTSSRSMIAGKRVPGRDYMPVKQRDLETVGKTILDSLKS